MFGDDLTPPGQEAANTLRNVLACVMYPDRADQVTDAIDALIKQRIAEAFEARDNDAAWGDLVDGGR